MGIMIVSLPQCLDGEHSSPVAVSLKAWWTTHLQLRKWLHSDWSGFLGLWMCFAWISRSLCQSYTIPVLDLNQFSLKHHLFCSIMRKILEKIILQILIIIMKYTAKFYFKK